jgi:hypothetical protein
MPMLDTTHGPDQRTDPFEHLMGRRIPLFLRDRGLLD